jgi:hypothetical protein
MKTKNKKAIRTGNRCGKTETSMDIMRANVLAEKPRRSIPVKEVNEMIEREVSRVKSERTIYDDRNNLIHEINELEREVEHHEACLHRLEKNLISLKLNLNKTNTAIARELDLDSLR